MKLIFTIGCSGSGKSTWAHRQGIPSVEMDELRKSYLGDVNDQLQNQKIAELSKKEILKYVRNDKDVINANTNCNLYYLKQDIEMYSKYPNVEFQFVLFEVSNNPALCKHRVSLDKTDRSRTDTVPGLIERQSRDYQKVKKYIEENFENNIIYIK